MIQRPFQNLPSTISRKELLPTQVTPTVSFTLTLEYQKVIRFLPILHRR